MSYFQNKSPFSQNDEGNKTEITKQKCQVDSGIWLKQRTRHHSPLRFNLVNTRICTVGILLFFKYIVVKPLSFPLNKFSSVWYSIVTCPDFVVQQNTGICTPEHWSLRNSFKFFSPFYPHYLSLTFAFNITSSSVLQFLIFKDVIGHDISFTLLTLTCSFLIYQIIQRTPCSSLLMEGSTVKGDIQLTPHHSLSTEETFLYILRVFCSSLLDHAPPYKITCSFTVNVTLSSFLPL